MKKFISEYEKKKAEFEKHTELQKKRDEEKKKPNKEKNDSEKGSRFEKELPGQSIGNAPLLQWPTRFQINTQLHLEQHWSRHQIDPANLRSSIDITQLPLSEFTVDDYLVFLLFCGVGVYAPDLIDDEFFNNAVLNSAKEGGPYCVITNHSLAFGANFKKVERVFIMPDFAESVTLNLYKQAAGRAGRAGKSAKATLYMDPVSVLKFQDFIANPCNCDDDQEAQNINRTILCQSIREYWKNREDAKKREYEDQRSREVDEQLIARARYLTQNMDQTLSQIEAREAKQRQEADENKANWRSNGLRDPAPKKAISWRNKPDVPERSEPKPLAQSTGLDVSRKMGNSILSYCERCNTDGMFGMKCCCGGYFMPKKAESWRNKPDAPQRSDPSPLAQSTGKYVPPQRPAQEPNPHKWRDQCTESKCIERTPETAQDANRNFSELRTKPDAPQSSSTSSGSDTHKQDQLRYWLKKADSLPPAEVTAWQTRIRHNDLSKWGPIETPQNVAQQQQPCAQSNGLKYVPPNKRIRGCTDK